MDRRQDVFSRGVRLCTDTSNKDILYINIIIIIIKYILSSCPKSHKPPEPLNFMLDRIKITSCPKTALFRSCPVQKQKTPEQKVRGFHTTI